MWCYIRTPIVYLLFVDLRRVSSTVRRHPYGGGDNPNLVT